MQLQEVKPIHKTKRKKRVGRGGKRGFYSGRGAKGQRARAGRKFQPLIRKLIKRYPKLRGYRFKSKTQNPKPKIINLDILEKKFNSGEVVTPQILLEKRLIRRIKGETPQVKILAKGEISKSLTIENCLVSQSAKEKIEKAHGVVK